MNIARPWSHTNTDCCKCGEAAKRSEVNHVGFSGFAATPRDQQNYRQSFREFKEASEEVDYHYTRAENNGDPVKSPNLFQEGLKQAKAMGA